MVFDIGSAGQRCAVCNCDAKWCLWIDAQNFGEGLPHIGKVAACFAAFLALQFQEAHRGTATSVLDNLTTFQDFR